MPGRANSLSVQQVVGSALVALMLALPGTPASAALIELELDSARSTLNLTAVFENPLGDQLPLEEQGAGTLTAHFTGTARVDLTPNTIALEILTDAVTQAGLFLPTPQGAPFGAPASADLAGRVVNPVPSGQGLYAARDMGLNLGSLPIAIDASGNIDVSGVLGVLSYQQAFFTGTADGTGVIAYPFSPQFVANDALALGSFRQVGDEYVLTVPFEIPWTIGPFTQSLVPVSGRLHGQFVAVASVPELGSAWLLLGAGVGICCRCRGRTTYRCPLPGRSTWRRFWHSS